MESSDAETVDCAVGTIVWVRRRNGSWWPGKILGPDELSASHLMSPRSGTPVKLLGREDASVDWYNLEKSKRVKPFRCGEFDDCIERAEASQGMPPKKREKYARREDAILHALELEKQVLEKKYGKSPTNGLSTKALTVVVDDKRKRDDDSFRDLIKHKPNGENVAGKKVLEKRKRSQEGNNNNNNNMEETVGKRRDRHRPLVQVLESTHPLQSKADEQQRQVVAIANDPGMTAGETFSDQAEVKLEVEPPIASSEDNNTSGSNEDTETDSSGTESLISDTYDAMAALSEKEGEEFIRKAFGRCEGQGAVESMSDEESGVSKWKLKGKRKTRNSNSNSRNWMMGDLDSVESMKSHLMLIDVEVGVQSGYQREHVPMISLMSKLNDKAIVGHPIPVQALEDGSSLCEEFQVYDLQPWRTARRTTRPPHLSTLEEQEEEEEDVNRGSKGRKNPQRRSTSACSSQKIRTLSSIGGTQQQHLKGIGIGMMMIMMMKPESLPTAVACIPVKLVFSRLHEDLLAPRHQ